MCRYAGLYEMCRYAGLYEIWSLGLLSSALRCVALQFPSQAPQSPRAAESDSCWQLPGAKRPKHAALWPKQERQAPPSCGASVG